MNLSHGGAPPLVSGDDSGSFSVRIRPAAFAETGSRLFAGDWGTLPEVVQQVAAVSWGDHQYDLILTSETIYSTASYDKLIGAMSSLLRRPSGVAYVLPSPPLTWVLWLTFSLFSRSSPQRLVSAKTYYFGIGGGTHAFTEKLLETGQFAVTPVFSVHGGVHREILQVTWKQ